MLGSIKIEFICDSCCKEKKEIEVTPLTSADEKTNMMKVVVFADHFPEGWTEIKIAQELKYICEKCMKGVPNSGFAF